MTITELIAARLWTPPQPITTLQPGTGPDPSFRDYLMQALTASFGGATPRIVLQTENALNADLNPSLRTPDQAQPDLTTTQKTTTTTIDWDKLRGILRKLGTDLKDLLTQISASTDVGQRRELGAQFTQSLVTALNAAGFTAATTDSADKILVNGVTLDVIRSLNSAGKEVTLQMHVIDTLSGSPAAPSTLKEALQLAATELEDLINQINNATTIDERRDLVRELQSKVVEYLNQFGFSASITDKPDKITVNGVLYDFVRHANTLGKDIVLQTLTP
ncbi:MAG: hypothetical protein HYX75_21765 [Acidobacteria bacterium]|nr:hypothetical protein [Acidobacteriota bacterium]